MMIDSFSSLHTVGSLLPTKMGTQGRRRNCSFHKSFFLISLWITGKTCSKLTKEEEEGTIWNWPFRVCPFCNCRVGLGTKIGNYKRISLLWMESSNISCADWYFSVSENTFHISMSHKEPFSPAIDSLYIGKNSGYTKLKHCVGICMSEKSSQFCIAHPSKDTDGSLEIFTGTL